MSIIPASAPFNDEQKAWLNGFFAGLLGVEDSAEADEEAAAVAVASLQNLGENRARDAGGAHESEDFPWHDPTLDMDERMKLAEGQPLERRLMAATAQLDCGACGYLCKTYSEAIARGEEKNLSLCVPGGKETSKALKRLAKEGANGNGAAAKPATNGTKATLAAAKGEPVNGQAAASGWSRMRPFPAKLIESRPLNAPGSAKDTRHVAIDLAGSNLRYSVGDSLGVWPTNCAELVDAVIAAAHLDPEQRVPVGSGVEKTLRAALREDYCLKEPTDELLECLAASARGGGDFARLTALREDQDALDSLDVLDVLLLTPTARFQASEFLRTLNPLAPRLYSIASSQQKFDQQVHLTVGRVSYESHGRARKGVASTMLADRVAVGDEVRVFVQPSHGFTVPLDPQAPMIMVGPGTGIAPFLAFLQERDAIGASGPNWLFFGDQHGECDFLYRQQLEDWLSRGLLSRLDTAFSRDQEQKIYVQDRMLQQGAEIYRWISEGGYFYVCGDASRMAADVDRALHAILQQHGQMTADEAAGLVKSLAKQKRYMRDVY